MTQPVAQVRNVVSRTGYANPLPLVVPVSDVTYVRVFADDEELVRGVDYTVSGVGAQAGVEITIIGADDPNNYTGYSTFTALFDPPLDQQADLSAGGNFGRPFETAMDQQNRRLQAVGDRADRALKAPVNSGADMTLPPMPPDGEWTPAWDADNGEWYWTETPESAAGYAAQAAASALAAYNSEQAAAGYAGDALQAKGDAISARDAAVQAKDDAVQAQGLAEAAAQGAADDKDLAEAAALAAADAQGLAEAAALAAAGSASSASGFAGAAQGHASDAQGYASDAQGYASDASGFATDAQGFASAASGSAGAASGSADDAAQAQEAAEDARDLVLAALASVNLPVIQPGDAGKVITVKGDESGYELGAGGGSAVFPPGGATDEVLAKASAADDDVKWLALGTAAAADTGDFATAAQGAKADTALQPAAIGATVAAQNDSRFGTVPDGYVTPAKMDNGAALSVLGRSANSAGVRADITADTNNRILSRVSNALGFNQLNYFMIESGAIATANDMMGGVAAKLLTAETLKDEIQFSPLIDAGTLSWNFATGNNRSVTLGGNRTLGNLTNGMQGAGFCVKVFASGSTRTLALGNQYVVGQGVESFPISVTTSETVHIFGIVDTTTRFLITGVIRS